MSVWKTGILLDKYKCTSILAKHIIKQRKALNLTQKEVDLKIGAAKGLTGNIENCRHNPSFYMGILYCKVLGIDPFEVLDELTPPN